MKKIKYSGKFLIVIVSCFFIISCDDSGVKNNTPGLRIVDPTILQTDEFGNILRGDTTDWCFNSTGLFYYYPAFPNPTSDTTKLDFALPEHDTITIYYFDVHEDSVFVVRDQPLNAGHYNMAVSGKALWLNGKVVRFYIRTKGQPGGGPYCRLYGDVQFY